MWLKRSKKEYEPKYTVTSTSGYVQWVNPVKTDLETLKDRVKSLDKGIDEVHDEFHNHQTYVYDELETHADRLDDLEGDVRTNTKDISRIVRAYDITINSLIRRIQELEEWQQKIEERLANTVTNGSSTKRRKANLKSAKDVR